MNSLNELAKKQIYDDYKEVLSTDAGKRVVGGIFYRSGLNSPGVKSEYYQGVRDFALVIANTIREIDPHLIADCETAYKDFERRFDDDDRNRDDDGTDYAADY